MTGRRFEIEASRIARCAPEQVLDRILRPKTWPAWQSEILAVDGPERVHEDAVVRGDARLLGFNVEGHSTSLEVTEQSYLEDVIVGVRMQVRYTVVGEGEGSRVIHHLVSDLPGGIAGSVLSLFLKWRLRKMQRMLLADLVGQSEDAARASG